MFRIVVWYSFFGSKQAALCCLMSGVQPLSTPLEITVAWMKKKGKENEGKLSNNWSDWFIDGKCVPSMAIWSPDEKRTRVWSLVWFMIIVLVKAWRVALCSILYCVDPHSAIKVILFSYPNNNMYLYKYMQPVLLTVNLDTFSMWAQKKSPSTHPDQKRRLKLQLAVSLLNRGPAKPNTCFATLSAITRPPAHKRTSRICVFASAPLLPFDSAPGPGAAATAATDAFQRPFCNTKGDTNLAANTSTVDRRAPRCRRALQVSLMSKH